MRHRPRHTNPLNQILLGYRRAVGMPHGYFVNRQGRILSMHWSEIKEMKQGKDNYGYFRVGARAPAGHRGRFYPYKVHSVVCATFHGLPPIGAVARHLDGNRENNNAENLTWGTPLENSQDMVRHGNQLAGERHPLAKLTKRQAAEILAELGRGTSQRSLARRYGVSPSVVYRIAKGTGWRCALSEAS